MMRGTVFIFLLFGMLIHSPAQKFNEKQQEQINKYNEIIENSNSPDTAVVAAYVGLSETFAYVHDYEASGSLALKGVELAEKALPKYSEEGTITRLSALRATGLTNYGNLLQSKGRLTEALEYTEKGFYIRKQLGNNFKIAESLNNLANLHHSLGNLAKAIDMMQESIMMLEDDEHLGQGMININMATLYNDQGEYLKGIEATEKGLKHLEKIDMKIGLAYGYNAKAYAYRQLGESEKSLAASEQALKISREIENSTSESGSLYNKALVYMDMMKLDSAIALYGEALDIVERTGEKLAIAQFLNYLGEAYLIKAQLESNSAGQKMVLLDRGQEVLQRSMDLAREMESYSRVKNVSRSYHQLLAEKGDYKAAYEMIKIHTEAMDSVNGEEAQNALTRIEYEKAKATSQAEHDAELAVAAAKEEKQKLYTYSIAGGLGLSGLFLFVVFNRLRVTKKQKQIIESQKALVEESHKEITDSIHYAKRIQAAVLPPDSVVKKHLPGSFVLYKPKDIVAGDFYWLEEKNGTVFFASADCTGHGVPGAMVSVVCVSGLNRSLREMNITEPGKILDKTRELVVKEFEKSDESVQDGMDIALCSLNGMKLQYAGAHNPLWIVRNGELLETKADKQPIGKYDNPEPYTTHSLELQHGDTLYIFSDGYPDQFGGEKGKKYKSGKFKETLIRMASEPISDQKKLLDREFEAWRGDHEQIDDVCVIGVKI